MDLLHVKQTLVPLSNAPASPDSRTLRRELAQNSDARWLVAGCREVGKKNPANSES